MIMTEDKTATSASITSPISSSATTTSNPVANMDETDWTTMLMEMRVLSA